MYQWVGLHIQVKCPHSFLICVLAISDEVFTNNFLSIINSTVFWSIFFLVVFARIFLRLVLVYFCQSNTSFLWSYSLCRLFFLIWLSFLRLVNVLFDFASEIQMKIVN